MKPAVCNESRDIETNEDFPFNHFKDPLKEILTFRKRGGTTNQGTNYEVYVTALIAQRLAFDDSTEELQIASNHADFGAFDDVIVQVRKVGQKNQIFGIQLKHKTTRKTINEGFFTTDDFCLLKYKESFLEVINSKCSDENSVRLDPHLLKDAMFCLFTNLDIEENNLMQLKFRLRDHMKKSKCGICLKFPKRHHYSDSIFCTIKREEQGARTKFIHTKGHCYRFKIHSLPDNLSENDYDTYKSFFNRFQFYAGQMSSEEIKCQIICEFMSKFGSIAHDIGEQFISFIDDWFFKKSDSGWLNKEQIKLKILELLLSPLIVEPAGMNVRLQQPDLWYQIVSCANVIVLDENVDDVHRLSKIYCSAQDKIKDTLNVILNFTNWMEYINTDVEIAIKDRRYSGIINTVPEHGRINSKRLFIACWKMGVVPLILKVDENKRGYVINILNKNAEFAVRYVLMGKNLHTLKLKPEIKILTNMKINTRIIKTQQNLKSIGKLLNSCYITGSKSLPCLKLQPGYLLTNTAHINHILVKVETVLKCEYSCLSKAVNYKGLAILKNSYHRPVKILQALRKRLVCLYKQIEVRDFVKADVFKRVLRVIKIIEKINHTIVNLIHMSRTDDNAIRKLQISILKGTKISMQGRRETSLYEIVNDNMKNLAEIMQEINPALLLKFMSNTAVFSKVHNATVEIGAKLQPNASDYIERNFKARRLIVSERDLLNKLQKKINVISGDPGMGKTTVLKSLAFHCDPKIWVLLLNLNNIQEDFNNPLKCKLWDDPIAYLFRKTEDITSSFTRALFNYLRRNHKIVIILDSFDEVSPKYNEIVLNLVKQFEKENLCAWIATRPFAKSFIEKAFTVQTVYLLGFTEHDFRNYLSLHSVSKEDEDFILKHIDKKFYNIPLHAYMLTTVGHFHDDVEITDVYEKFINHKFNAFCEKHDLLECKNNIDILTKPSREELIRNHEAMALALIYGMDFFKIVIATNHIQLIKNFEDAIQNTENCKNPLGLVIGVSNEIPVFIHKSYAEFMVAKWLSLNITNTSKLHATDMFTKLNPTLAVVKKTDNQEVSLNIKLYEKLFEPKHKLVRSMFDKIAAKGNPLLLAILNSNLDKVKKICNETLIGNSFDIFGRSPLHLAIAGFEMHDHSGKLLYEKNKNQCKILSILLEYFATKCKMDLLIPDSFGWTYLKYAKMISNNDLIYVATHYGELNILHFFLQYVDENELQNIVNRKNLIGATLLHLAAEKGFINVVTYLCTKGANAEERDQSGNVPLLIAAKYGHLDVVKYFIDAGVNKNTVNEFGDTPLHVAAKSHHLHVVKYLVRINVNSEVENNFKRTPLHLAAENGYLNIVEYLVNEGVKVTAEDIYGCTPSYLAAENGHSNVVKFLTEKEANLYRSFIESIFEVTGRDNCKVCEKDASTATDVSHMENYIAVLVSLYAVRLTLSEYVEDMCIGCNLPEFGGFGDVVIRVKYKNKVSSQHENKLFAMKIKYADGNSMEELDFLEIKNGYTSTQTVLTEKSNFDELINNVSLDDMYLCLYTNAIIHKNSDKIKLTEDNVPLICNISTLCQQENFAATKQSGCYKLVDTREEKKQSEILSKFQLYTDQTDFEGIETLLKLLLENEFGHTDKDSVTKIIKYVVNFYKNEEPCFLTQQHIKSKLLRFMLSSLVVEPEMYIPVSINWLVWNELVLHAHITVVNDDSADMIRKIYYTMQEQIKTNSNIFLNLKLWMKHDSQHPIRRYFENIKQMIMILWERKGLPLLLKVQSAQEGFLKKVLNKLFISNRRYIIMGNCPRNLRDDFKVFENFKLANDDQKAEIMKDIRVSLQGRSSTDLYQLTDRLNRDAVSSTFLFRMDRLNKIGTDLERKPDIYINRRLFKILLREEILWKTEGNLFLLDGDISTSVKSNCDTFAVNVIKLPINNDITRLEITNIGNKNVVIVASKNLEQRFQQLLDEQNLKIYNKYYLKVEGNWLEWRSSCGSLKDLNNFIIEQETVEEEDLLKYYKDRLNVISAVPGMGKSTLLNSLAWKCNSEDWVLLIKLSDYSDDLQHNLNKLLNDPVDYIYNKECSSSNSFEKEVFSMCKKQKKVMVLIDEFEAICPKYVEAGLNLIEKLTKEEIRVWITVRPLAKVFIQEKFSLMSISIQELTDAESKFYLFEELYTPTVLETNILFTKITSSFYKIPLHLNILVELLNFQKLNVKQFELGEWYKQFILKKFTDGSDAVLTSYEEKLMHDSKLLALISVYGRKFVMDSNVIYDEYLDKLLTNTAKNFNDIGLVIAIKDAAPVFVHQKFCDYLVSSWLLENMDYQVCKVMYKMLFDGNWQSVRCMFDKFASNGHPLHLAVLSYDAIEVQRLCKDLVFSGKYHKDSFGRTPLHLAVSHFKELNVMSREHKLSCIIVSEIIDYLSEGEQDLQCVDFLLQWNWLKYAVESGNLELFHIASYWGHINILKLYLETVKTHSIVNKFSKDGYTPLELAAMQGHRDVIEFLMENGASGYVKSLAILRAASRGQLNAIQLLIKENSDVNFVDKNGCSALHEAVKNNEIQCVEYLVNAGLKVNCKTKDGCTLLHYAAERGQAVVMNCLLSKGASVDEANFKGSTPLHLASSNGHGSCLELLIKAHANVNLKTNDGFTSLHNATEKGYIDIVVMLVKAGAAVNEVNKDGRSSLHFAAFGGHKNCVEYLIKLGADVNITDNNGLTPLQLVPEMALDAMALVTKNTKEKCVVS